MTKTWRDGFKKNSFVGSIRRFSIFYSKSTMDMNYSEINIL